MTIDNLLIEKLKSDNSEAFEEIYNCYAPQLVNYASARLSSLEEAKDLVHDVFVRFYERRAVLNIEVSIRTYLFAALKYKMIDHIRRNTNKQFYEEMLLSLKTDTAELVFDHTVYNNLSAIMNKEVDRLPQRVKETFILSRRWHMSIPEIATEMNVSEQTVKNQLSAAIKKLRCVKVEIAGKKLLFASTHLDHLATEENRILQANTIVQEILPKLKLPLIIGGDLNATPESETIGILNTKLLMGCKDQGCPLTFPYNAPDRCIDYIMVGSSKDFEFKSYKSMEGVVASDHLPLVAEIALK